MKKDYFDYAFIGSRWLFKTSCDWVVTFGALILIGFWLMVSPVFWFIGRIVRE
jgi:hypothetical protein